METDYRKAANITIIIIGIVLLFRLIFEYALGALIPFALAAIIAVLITPLSKKLFLLLATPFSLTLLVKPILTKQFLLELNSALG